MIKKGGCQRRPHNNYEKIISFKIYGKKIAVKKVAVKNGKAC
jgi:hypothetical protein